MVASNNNDQSTGAKEQPWKQWLNTEIKAREQAEKSPQDMAAQDTLRENYEKTRGKGDRADSPNKRG